MLISSMRRAMDIDDLWCSACRRMRAELGYGRGEPAGLPERMPFDLDELEARVRALTRRGLGTASSVIKHGPLTFDATGRVAYINDQMIELLSINPTHKPRELPIADIEWIARIVWASQ